MLFEEKVADISNWSSEQISELWKEMDLLYEKAKQEGWGDEFLHNVKEWIEAGGRLPVRFLKLRRKDWK